MHFNHNDQIDVDRVVLIQYLPPCGCVSFIYDPDAPEDATSSHVKRAALGKDNALALVRQIMGDDSIELTREGHIYTWRRPT